MIELKHVQKAFPDATPLKDVNVVINDGDVISVIGPSGTGKSTLLRCINLLDPPTKGEIILDGEVITAKGYDRTKVNKKIGMVFQSFNLFNHLTVLENIVKPQMDLLGRERQEAVDKAVELLKTVGLSEKVFRYPDELSGGQKQRVAIVRTVAMDPDVILFDEPTSALDPTMVGEVQNTIKNLAKTGTTMMIVTHEMKFAREICSRVFYMDEGGVYEEGTPEEIFENPKKENTRRFIKRLKCAEFNITEADASFYNLFMDILAFCQRNALSVDATNYCCHIIEELVMQILIPHLGKDVNINITIECAEDSVAPLIYIKYGGDIFAPEDFENEIAFKLVKGSAEEITHSKIDEAPYTNLLTAATKC